MIKRTTLNLGDVLVITDKNGVEIMALSLTELQGDNELLIDTCDKNTGYNQTYNARQIIGKLRNPDGE
ncbi:hypothetical protein GO003_024510 [Methylicorpusculum oleiharenae]|uniref:hypothetical protein n=1 Tax=Methylicorpusculum oleiharenae TaxID=1338687 RepID=UPI00135B5699|nr:hypothetical protein [Methylicorpusculum oleiharenae]MCD2453546.1 hypothetical protein [Methylicorpusculum oleiharenae]